MSIFSKYLNDDGGPSYWWRDKRIEQLHCALAEHDASERVQQEILDLIGPRDPDLIERFERMISRLRGGQITNAADLLDRFAAAEDRDLLAFRLERGVLVGLAPGLITTSIGVFFTPPFSWLHCVLWAVTVLSIPLSIWALTLSRGDHLGTKELEGLRCKADAGVA